MTSIAASYGLEGWGFESFEYDDELADKGYAVRIPDALADEHPLASQRDRLHFVAEPRRPSPARLSVRDRHVHGSARRVRSVHDRPQAWRGRL